MRIFEQREIKQTETTSSINGAQPRKKITCSLSSIFEAIKWHKESEDGHEDKKNDATNLAMVRACQIVI